MTISRSCVSVFLLAWFPSRLGDRCRYPLILCNESVSVTGVQLLRFRLRTLLLLPAVFFPLWTTMAMSRPVHSVFEVMAAVFGAPFALIVLWVGRSSADDQCQRVSVFRGIVRGMKLGACYGVCVFLFGVGVDLTTQAYIPSNYSIESLVTQLVFLELIYLILGASAGTVPLLTRTARIKPSTWGGHRSTDA